MITSASRVMSVCASVLAGLALAGPLTPPPGAVAPTGKTTDEIEPRIAINAQNTPGDSGSVFRITQPGSYYLTGNVTGVAGRDGIEVVAEDVTIDLGGFSLIGVPGSLNGILANSGSVDGLRVRNGIVSNWGNLGIFATTADSAHVEGITARANGSNGITLGSVSVVRNCIADANGGIGIRLQDGGRVVDCTASRNGTFGISANFASVISGCSAFRNTLSGISASVSATISECTSYDNEGAGIIASAGSQVVNCTARLNNDGGISLTGSGGMVHGCSLAANEVFGISTNGNSSVLDNAVVDHPTGIRVVNNSIVRNNNVVAGGNTVGNVGILVESSDNRIEGNNVESSGIGYDINALGNIVLRNAASGNSKNYEIASGNRVAVIVSPPGSGQIDGSTGGAGLGTTDANANFSY
ncbi:MAG: right-handed parallel beta-helix repeat-containing protein [Planctomycetota bacterium]